MRQALESAGVREALVTPGSPWTGVLVLESTDSTNAEVVRRGRLWYAVLADHQEGGRGRRGRSWRDVPRAGVAASALVPAPRSVVGWVPLVAGLAVHQAVREVADLETVLKWPNDVLVPADGDRKLSGVLCEMTSLGIVVGAGINVDQDREELPVPTATSLRLAGAPGVSREALAAAFLRHLAAGHAALAGRTEERRRLQQLYRSRCATIGADIELHLHGDERRRARAEGVDDHGCLVVRRGSDVDTVAAGDVVHVRPSARRAVVAPGDA